MFELKIENKAGEIFNIINGADYAITNISGLNPPSASISTSVVSTLDGERLSNARMNMRNMVLTLKIQRNVEENRILLYRFFKVKQYCKIYYKNDSRNVYIEGYVEAFEDDFFTKMQTVQISILCPEPYFKNMEEVYFNISQVLSMFEFPFSIESDGIPFSEYDTTLVATIKNNGDVESGIEITISASGEITNPKIYNADTRKMFGLNVIMIKGDVIVISTVKGRKTVELIRGGVRTNIINLVMKNPEWFQMEPGENHFTYNCDSGNEFFYMSIKHVDLYEGV